MKKAILIMFVLVAIATNSFAQNNIVVQTPGLFSDISNALIGIPCQAVGGIVSGTLSGIGDIVHGRTTVITNAPPVVPPPPMYHPSTVVVSPALVPAVSVPSTVTKQVVSPTGTVTTVTNGVSTSVSTSQVVPGAVVNTTYIRPASVLDTGIAPVPVPIEHRVGSSVYVNPYVYRYR